LPFEEFNCTDDGDFGAKSEFQFRQTHNLPMEMQISIAILRGAVEIIRVNPANGDAQTRATFGGIRTTN
jgi:hypothetical protein